MKLRVAVLVVAPFVGACNSPLPVASSGTGTQVVIGFYLDSQCTPGTEVGQRRYDTGQECFSWSAAGSHAHENSASEFRCYRDRLCYTQHPSSLTCSQDFATHKEARTGECVKEPAGKLYARVLSGTEDCPPPPDGFACPSSAPGAARP